MKKVFVKKAFALALTLILALGLAGSAFAEAERAEIPVTEETSLDPQAIFDQATEGLLGSDIEMLALTGKDDTLGIMIYSFLCRITAVAPDAEPTLGMLLASVSPEGDAELLMVFACPATEDGAPAVLDAGMMSEGILLPVAQFPAGTAGASLQTAQTVCDIWLICTVYDLSAMEPDAAVANAEEALSLLADEERTLFDENAPAILAEIQRLCDPTEELGGEYADAGVGELLTVLRGEDAVRASVAALASCLTAAMK